MTRLEHLRAALAEITKPGRYLDGPAGGARGDKVCPVMAFDPHLREPEAREAVELLSIAMGLPSPVLIGWYNGRHSLDEIVVDFKRAIADEEAREREFSVEPVGVA